MRKVKTLFATVCFGLMFAACATGPADDSANDPQQGVDQQSEQSAPAEVPANLQLEPNACVSNSCLGSRTCSSCCAGHQCVDRTGCPQLGLACN